MPIAIPGALNNLIEKFRKDRTTGIVLVYLLLFDIAFILVHIVRGVMKEKGIDIGFLESPRFSLLKDGGYAEWFNYAKIAIVCVLLLWIWRRKREFIYAALSFIFLVVLIDDSLSVHEAGGHLLLGRVGRDTSLGLHVRDLGELATWVLLGSFALVLFVFAYRKSRPEDAPIAAGFAGCLVVLTAFAVGVDMLHAIAPTRALDGLFGIIEDGGETVVLSLTCAIALLVFRHWRAPVRASEVAIASDSEGRTRQRKSTPPRSRCRSRHAPARTASSG